MGGTTMGQTGKSKRKTTTSKAEKRPRIKDLPAKSAAAVKGGAADIFAKLGDIKGESLDSR
jgi:hypothetical protein